MILARDSAARVGIGPASAGLKPGFSPEDGVNPEGPSRILVVEDERIVALDLVATLHELGYIVAASVSSGKTAIEQTIKLRPNLVLMDIRLAGEMDGIEAAQEIRKVVDVAVIYLTAHSDDPTLMRAKDTTPFGYLVKPFKPPELHCAIEIALHKHKIEAKLREHEAWLTTTLRSIGDAVVTTDPSERVTFLNPVAEALTGWSCEDAVGKVVTDVVNLFSEETCAQMKNPIHQALLDKTPHTIANNAYLVAKTGHHIPIDDSGAPIVGDKGEVLGGVMVFRDVTRQRQAEQKILGLNEKLEQRVVERTAQLGTANKELESFSYSIAHDLRAPLRGIDGFSATLIQDHSENLSPEGVDCLNRIRAGADRMRQLIDDLLRLARVTRQDFRRQKIDFTEIAKQVKADLQAVHKDPHAEFVIHDGVTVEGDGPLLRIVLENLLGNAWKFTSKVAAPKIEFGSVVDQGKQVCFVRDNGAGFDMKYADKLFGVFQRLHRTEEFEGTGIGLAIVERIINRHGGRIWAASLPGKGTTFFFVV